jgi:cell division protein FtsB
MKALSLLLAGALALGGCAHLSRPAVLGDVAIARQSPASVEAAELAPTSFAEAQKIQRDAEAAYDAGDPAGAQILGEQALAAYARAFLHARIARATKTLDEVKTDEAAASGELARLREEQARTGAEVTDLETRIKVVRDALPVVSSGEADAPREKARLEAARALSTEASLLCISTRLLAPDTEGLKAADQAATELAQSLTSSPRPAPIDAAMRARAGCLTVLGQAKRTASAAPGAAAQDGATLLAELSREGSFAPVRDERGVVVSVPDAFAGADLARGAIPKLELAAKIAAAHPAMPLLVVVHEAEGKDRKRSAQRTESVKKLITKGRAERVEVVSAGSSRPVVDPSQKKDQGRNDRVEVVFLDAGG